MLYDSKPRDINKGPILEFPTCFCGHCNSNICCFIVIDQDCILGSKFFCELFSVT